MSTDSWSTNAINYLFTAAQQEGFKLFFSFDMTHFSAPSGFLPLLEQYVSNSAYYQYNSLPFVSTFNGGRMTFGASSPNAGWKTYLIDALADKKIKIFFVPNFSDSTVAPSSFFDNFGDLDGVMGWDSAWPAPQNVYTNVSSTVDEGYMASAAKSNKVYMMRTYCSYLA